MGENKKKYLASLAVTMLFVLSISESVYGESISATPSISETAPSSNEYYPNKTIWPNRGAKSLTIPSGWGASGGCVFFGGGMTKPSPYAKNADGALSFGIGLGNPVKHVGIELAPAAWDVSKFDNFALDIKIHRYLGDASAIGVGGENLFADQQKTDAGQSYYIVFSHSFQRFPAHDPKQSALHGSIGIGSGRYGDKSPLDVQTGKGKHGTYVFGALAYEVFDSANIIAEWNGLNFNAGFGFAPLKKIPFGIILGVADLTRYSGDRIRFIASAGYSFQL